MLIRPDGATDGTVGGGCGEAEVWRTALEVMADEQARMVVVDLTNDIGLNTDGVCGGIMDIFVEPWTSSGDPITAGVLRAVADHKPAITATVVSRSRGTPCALGEKALIVDERCRAGALEWPALEERILADSAAVITDGRSQVRSYAFDTEV